MLCSAVYIHQSTNPPLSQPISQPINQPIYLELSNQFPSCSTLLTSSFLSFHFLSFQSYPFDFFCVEHDLSEDDESAPGVRKSRKVKSKQHDSGGKLLKIDTTGDGKVWLLFYSVIVLMA